MKTTIGNATVLSMLVLELVNGVNTESPNKPIPKPECDASIPVSVRYSSASSRLYIVSADGSTRGGCVTLNQIWKERGGKTPLYAVDPESGDISDSVTGIWLLTEELFVQDGITLQVGVFRLHFCLCLSHTACAQCEKAIARMFDWTFCAHNERRCLRLDAISW